MQVNNANNVDRISKPPEEAVTQVVN